MVIFSLLWKERLDSWDIWRYDLRYIVRHDESVNVISRVAGLDILLLKTSRANIPCLLLDVHRNRDGHTPMILGPELGTKKCQYTYRCPRVDLEVDLSNGVGVRQRCEFHGRRFWSQQESDGRRKTVWQWHLLRWQTSRRSAVVHIAPSNKAFFHQTNYRLRIDDWCAQYIYSYHLNDFWY